jgi:hypothetical protein
LPTAELAEYSFFDVDLLLSHNYRADIEANVPGLNPISVDARKLRINYKSFL